MDDCLERKFHCVISRLSVIQEADTGPTINILEATPGSAKPVSPTSNNLSNYFGTPQTSGAGARDSIFDQLTFPRSGPDQVVEAGGFTDISINTKRASNISPSHLPSQTDHCTDGPRANDGAGVPIGARLPVRASVSWIFAVKNHRFMVDIW